MSTTLHLPPTLFSLRHVPSWLLLAFGAGAVNAVAFLHAEQFVSHVTGTATRLGLEGASIVRDGLVLLGAFILGAMASVPALGGRVQRGLPPLHWLPMLAVSVLLAGVGAAGSLGAFGAGRAFDEPATVTLLALLAFTMGLQNATVATTTALAVRTTHMTGPATDLGVHLATLAYAQGEEGASARRGVLLRGGKLLAFVAGALAMVPATKALGLASLFVPAAAVLFATVLSFVPGWNRTPVHSRS